jgi:hypothetical protein
MPAISCIIIFTVHVLLFSQVLEGEADLLFHSSDNDYGNFIFINRVFLHKLCLTESGG